MDDMVLITLGNKEDVNYMIDLVGWTTFINMKYSTYVRVTHEFLRILEVNILQGEGYGEGKIIFRLFNTKYEWILAQFNSIYGLPVSGSKWDSNDFNV